MDDLRTAIARLREFRRSWNAGDVIDQESGLTADDLDVVLGALKPWEQPSQTGGTMLDELRHPSTGRGT